MRFKKKYLQFKIKPREYLDISLIKNIKDSYEENFITSVKDLRKNHGRDNLCF